MMQTFDYEKNVFFVLYLIRSNKYLKLINYANSSKSIYLFFPYLYKVISNKALGAWQPGWFSETT